MRKRKKDKAMKKLLVSIVAIVLALTCKMTVDASTSMITDMNGQQVSEATAHVITSGTASDLSKFTEYNLALATTEKEVVYPIKLTKSGDYQYIIGIDNTYGTSGYISSDIYSDKACTKRVSGVHATLFLSEETSKFGHVNIPKAGTYYLKLSASSQLLNNFETISVNLKGHLFNADNRTLTDKKATTTFTTDNKYVYYKVNVKKTGYLTVKQDYLISDKEGNFTVSKDGVSHITLCNSKKKALTTDCYNTLKITNNTQVFAVKKGSYYLKVKSSSYCPYRITSTFKTFADQGGSSKSSAKTIKLGGKATGLIQATDKKTKVDWYKFNLSKKRNITVSFSGNSCNSMGSIRIELVPPKKVILLGSTLYASGTSFKKVAKTKDKLNVGTWYIKVTKTNEKLTGNYTLAIK